MIPENIQRFIQTFSRLPSIGPRQATRLAFRLIAWGPARIAALSQALTGLAQVKTCTRCFFVHTNTDSLCSLCKDTHRASDIYMLLEKETDLISIERTGKYAGTYFILGELTKSGVLEDIHIARLAVLKQSIENTPQKKAREIIIALNPSTYGDLHTALLIKELAPYTEKITRLGRGIPTGGEIEFADEDTLGHSLERRN
ncbi:MAG: toprim domain-containing protein [Candidatus Paceibacterota bacterium]